MYKSVGNYKAKTSQTPSGGWLQYGSQIRFVYRQTFYGWIPAVAEDYMIKMDTNNTLVECCTEMLPFNIGVNIRTVKIQIFTVYTSVELLKICIYMRA